MRAETRDPWANYRGGNHSCIFGEPASVELRFEYFNAIREGVRAKYGFRFHAALPNNDLVAGGPLGEATDAHVYFTPDRKVLNVDWNYAEGYRLHNRTQEQRTGITPEQIEALAGRSPITIKNLQVNGFADAKSYDFDVDKMVHIQVFYMGSGSDVLLIVTRR